MAGLLFVQTLVWFSYLPNQIGKVSVDFSLWLPKALAGYYWYLKNGLFAIPWFTPSECAGGPFHADPEGSYLSALQLLTFIMPPLQAVKAMFLIFAVIGYWGAWHLARRTFQLSVAASLFAAAVFMLNTFFASRMVVGHLTFAPFMLLPAFAAAIIRAPDFPLTQTRAGVPDFVARACIGGSIIAICIEGGTVHILPPMMLSALIVALMHAMRFRSQPAVWARLAAAIVIGLCLSAGKLAASLALLSNFPRDQYPLPGFPSLFSVLYVAIRGLFTPVSESLGSWFVNAAFLLEQHEFEYGVSIAPLLLILMACGHAFYRGWRPRFRPLGIAIASLLLVPLMLNYYTPAWNAFLKGLPFFGNSSTLIRWFCTYILVAILAGAFSLDALAANRPRRATVLSIAGIAIMLATVGWSDHGKYGPPGPANPRSTGFYDPAALTAAWQEAHATGAVPPVTDIVEVMAGNQIQFPPERQNVLTQGFSILHCYQPIFGYRLEHLPIGQIRLGSATAAHDGVLNVKNPACYVFPGANHCVPGDPFPETRLADARAFLDYKPFPFAKPAYATLADALSLASLIALPLLFAWSVWRLRRPKRATPTALS